MRTKTAPRNPLNDLSNREWLFWTNSVWETAYPLDPTHKLRKAHGAIKPPRAMAEIVRFFSKSGELVLDPFAGVGGILLGAALENRRGLGFELSAAWVEVFEELRRRFNIQEGDFVEGPGRSIDAELRQGDCLRLVRELEDESIHAVITDPPYGVNHRRDGFAEETNFGMVSDGEGDFGGLPTTEAYLESIATLGRELHRVLLPGRYAVFLVGDRYQDGEYQPIGHLVACRLRSVGFRLKGMKVWNNKSTLRPLRPYALGRVFVPNITHQHVLVLRKE